MEPINVQELEAIARERLPRDVYDYYASGAEDESTLRENRAAFERLKLAYRVLVDVSHRDLSTTVLGQPISFPVVVAPTVSIAWRRRRGRWRPPAPPGSPGR